MDISHSIMLGIVEGFTEFLPISSTAHLVLTSKLLGIEVTEFLKSFEIIIQLGAISAVVFIYWKTLLLGWDLNKKILVAFAPTAVIGLSLYSLIKGVLLDNHIISVYALLIGGFVLIIFESFHKEKEENVGELNDISYKKAFLVGLFQSIAIVPGVSRSAATIIGGLSLGIKRKAIVEFSFLLAIPTMLAATGLDLLKSLSLFTSADFASLGVGFVVAFITAVASIKFLLKFIQDHDFKAFGIYRIILALTFLFLYS